MPNLSKNLEKVAEEIKEGKITEAIKIMGKTALYKRMDEALENKIKEEVKKNYDNKTNFSSKEWLSHLWKRHEIIRNAGNRHLTRIVGTGIISVAILGWTLLTISENIKFNSGFVIFLISVFVVSSLIFIIIISFLAEEEISLFEYITFVILFSLLAFYSEPLMLKVLAGGLALLQIFVLLLALFGSLKFMKYRKKFSPIKIFDFTTYKIYKKPLIYYTIILVIFFTVFSSQYNFNGFSLDNYRISILFSGIIILSFWSLSWWKQYLKFKKEERFLNYLIRDIMTGEIVEPKTISAIFNSYQDINIKNHIVGYIYLKELVREIKSNKG